MKNFATALALVGVCALVVIVHDSTVMPSGPTLTQAAPRTSSLASSRSYSACGEVLAACGRAVTRHDASH